MTLKITFDQNESDFENYIWSKSDFLCPHHQQGKLADE